MTTSPAVLDYRAVCAWVTGRMIFLELTDGRQIGFSADRIQRLHNADDKQLATLTLCLSGAALHWKNIDEDITVRDIVKGRFLLPLPSDCIAA